MKIFTVYQKNGVKKEIKFYHGIILHVKIA